MELRRVRGVPRFPIGGSGIAGKAVDGGVSEEGLAPAETVEKGREGEEEEESAGGGDDGDIEGVGGG